MKTMGTGPLLYGYAEWAIVQLISPTTQWTEHPTKWLKAGKFYEPD